MFRDLIINLLCLASIVGGSAATALSFEGERPEPKVAVSVDAEREIVVALKPEQLTAWSTAVANAIPVIAASLLLVWSNYRATKRRIEAEDAAVAVAKDHVPGSSPQGQEGRQEGRQDGELPPTPRSRPPGPP